MSTVNSLMPYYNPNTLITNKISTTERPINQQLYMGQQMVFKQICAIVFQANPKAKALFDYYNLK